MGEAATDQQNDATPASLKDADNGNGNSGHAASPVQLLGPAALGVAAGYLTGTTGYDSYVLAAVIPAALATAGSLAYVFLRRGNRTDDASHASIVVGVFSIALLLAAIGGKYMSELAIAEHRKEYSSRLPDCSHEQFKINGQRKTAGLEPLAIHQVCPEIPSSAPRLTNGQTGSGSAERGDTASDPIPQTQ